MKKQIITSLCISALLISNTVFAAEISKTIKGFGFNITTPSTSTAQQAAKSTVNKAAMKAQIAAINSKVNSVSSTYQSTLNNLANNLLPAEQLKKYNEEKAKIQSSTGTKANINIEIAEDGSVVLNKYLKSSNSKETFKSLTTAQKAAVKKDLNSLKNISSSYSQIAEQSKTLAKQVKSDPVTALELKSDLKDMVKTQVKVAKQIKSITKLSTNITTSAAKAGVSF
ncbi:hypothetical protein IJ707_03200 [bacterium]|nr:hypothetical protein [bacterium]